jgi:hypothetical protein
VRTHIWIIVLCLGTGFAKLAWAQRTGGFGGSQRQLTFTPIDTSKAIVKPIVPQQSRPFSLRNFVPKLSLPSFLTRKGSGVSPLAPSTSFPRTSQQSPIQPVTPIVPKS